ncbi:uncharacterized protein LOC124165655 [Ischnura elegans]|uniref:uncharacterized protein LOC124165655 n=1 Tax=Ischnura elegans TaxID=197161 RepID=UPI001ED8AE3C|nr:uncharacterized protein LOC124165655 [Ischnura elegans]
MANVFSASPVCFALLLHLMGVTVFTPLWVQSPGLFIAQESPKGPLPPFLASSLVSLGVSILLLQYSLWPKTFRKPPGPLLFLVQMLIALFIHEFVLNMMWYPVEGLVYELFQMSSQMANSPDDTAENAETPGLCCEVLRYLMTFMSCQMMPIIASYIMSVAFLGCVLHVTKIQEVYKGSC